MAALRAILLLTLLTLSLPALAATEKVVIAEPTAMELVDALGCRGCHHLDRRGGRRGPALDGVGKRYDAAKLRLWLQWPQSLQPGTVMPSYNYLAPEQINLLVDFLQRQK